ncbi:MAG: hypothetical protein ISS26_04510 [Candidatus Omnitrophica bacterium]|nr:hypothetical protein [Candidatus Omnitrophota bacterium]
MKIKAPDFIDSSNYGTIISYFVEEGSAVEKGQDLLEMETDKALIRIGAPASGIVRAIYKSAGSDVNSGDELLEIEENR